MKIIHIIIAVIITAGVLVAGQAWGIKPPRVEVPTPSVPGASVDFDGLSASFDYSVVPTENISISATGTASVMKYTPYLHDTTYKSQGFCGIYKDSDGDGFTYVTYNDGVQSLSATGCDE